MVSVQSNWELWNAIGNKDVAKVDRAGRGSGKARYFSTNKLLMAEFEIKVKLVWIARK